MTMVEPQFIEQNGEPAFVVLPIAEWRLIIEQLEDIEDALDIEASANDPHRRTIPAAVVDRLLDDEPPLKVWREHRGLSRSELAAMTGPSHPAISAISKPADATAPPTRFAASQRRSM
jgi:hypothetical protein